MAEVSARATALAEEHQYLYHYSWLGDYLERLEGKEAYREFRTITWAPNRETTPGARSGVSFWEDFSYKLC
jgi:hypothetical protein